VEPLYGPPNILCVVRRAFAGGKKKIKKVIKVFGPKYFSFLEVSNELLC
jgi:hypothetical protein